MLNIIWLLTMKNNNIAQYNRVIQGMWLNFEKIVHKYIDDKFMKHDEVERRLDEAIMTQDKQVMQGERRNFCEIVRWYIE